MRLLRTDYSAVHWPMLAAALALTGFGFAFVVSTTLRSDGGWGPEAQNQLRYFFISLFMWAVCLHVPVSAWRQAAWPLYACCLIGQVLMMVLAAMDSPLVPNRKGAHNWLVISSSFSVQPSEFFKLGSVLACAALLSSPGRDARKPGTVVLALVVAGLPALLLAKEDLGSAMTFVPMVVGMLILAGMRWSMLATLGGIGVAGLAAMVLALSTKGESSYQWRRLLAWWEPHKYLQTEAYQSSRSIRSVGSGQWFGKGWGQGEQNVLDWLPEKQTDMIYAIVSEESGFVGALGALLLFLAFAAAGLHAAGRCQNLFARLVIGGFICLVMGQMAINIAVVLQLMPVTGITLPFFSYGGSSLLALYLGLGIAMACSAAKPGSLDRLPG